jgi:hypothetical protein
VLRSLPSSFPSPFVTSVSSLKFFFFIAASGEDVSLSEDVHMTSEDTQNEEEPPKSSPVSLYSLPSWSSTSVGSSGSPSAPPVLDY